MANIKSQIKRNKQNVVARERNKAVKSELRTRAKNAVKAVGTENEDDDKDYGFSGFDFGCSLLCEQTFSSLRFCNSYIG